MGMLAPDVRILSLSRCWPLVALLGCADAAPSQPPPTPPPAPEVVEPEPEPPPAVSPKTAEVSPEPAADPPPPTSEGGHVVRQHDSVAHSSTVPTIPMSEPVVGTMDKDVIRRIVRAHIHEIRDCYNLGLAKDPALAGRIAIEFTIGPDGKVEEAEATDVTGFADPDVPTCIAEAIATWTFPAPRGGGRVNVSYPFNLVPG
jgi:hypothetical protein